MSDVVKLALIGLIGTAITTIGLAVIAYFQYGQKKAANQTKDIAASTEKKVDEVHELTNSRLSRIEKALEAMTADRDRLKDVVAHRPPPETE